MKLSYRPAAPEDFEFLFRLHEAAMRQYVEDSFGPWDEPWQRAYFRRKFEPGALKIIQRGGVDVGAVQVQQRTEEIYLARLEILPAYQRQGIGTLVLRELMAESDRDGRPVALQVLKSDVRARSLYQRLGFGVTGENDTHYIMAYSENPGILKSI